MRKVRHSLMLRFAAACSGSPLVWLYGPQEVHPSMMMEGPDGRWMAYIYPEHEAGLVTLNKDFTVGGSSYLIRWEYANAR